MHNAAQESEKEYQEEVDSVTSIGGTSSRPDNSCPACWSPLQNKGVTTQAVRPLRQRIECTGCGYTRYEIIEERAD